METLFPNDLLVGNKPCNSIGRGEEYLSMYLDHYTAIKDTLKDI